MHATLTAGGETHPLGKHGFQCCGSDFTVPLTTLLKQSNPKGKF
jgi:hypothetical protein